MQGIQMRESPVRGQSTDQVTGVLRSAEGQLVRRTYMLGLEPIPDDKNAEQL